MKALHLLKFTLVLLLIALVACRNTDNYVNKPDNEKILPFDAAIEKLNEGITAEEGLAGMSAAILPFRDTHDDGSAGAMTASALLVKLQESGSLKLIERQEVGAVLEEQLFDVSGISRESSQRAGEILNAKLVLVGELIRFEEYDYINVRVLDTQSAEIVYADDVCTGLPQTRAEDLKQTEHAVNSNGQEERRFSLAAKERLSKSRPLIITNTIIETRIVSNFIVKETGEGAARKEEKDETEYDITGRWRRLGDEFAGMEVEISEDGGFLAATITALPEGGAQGWRLGDSKWRRVWKTDDRVWRGQDLAIYVDMLSCSASSLGMKSYIPFKAVMQGDEGDRLYTAALSHNEYPGVGRVQQWVRVP